MRRGLAIAVIVLAPFGSSAAAPPDPGSLVAGRAAAAAPAATSEPDPDAVEAGDANLEPVGERSGITVSLAVGGALTLGFGMEDATGRGGAGTLRVGRVATRRTLITLELTGSALFHGASTDKTAQNRITTLEVGAQYYHRDRLWVRLGAGYASYVAHDVLLDKMTGARGNVVLRGGAGTFGIGIELAKVHRRIAVQLEAFSTAMINRDGLLASSGMLLGATFD